MEVLSTFFAGVPTKKIRLKWADLRPTTSPLYGFTEESVIPKGAIKLAIILGEAPRTVTTVIDFFVVNYLSAFNRMLGKPLLRTLKAVTNIHCLMIKFLPQWRQAKFEKESGTQVSYH